MRLVFAHDHILYKYDNKYYSSGGLSKTALERYTNVFDEVVVLCRQKKINTFNDNLTLASTEKVRFVKVPDFKSLKSIHQISNAKTIINKVISNSDLVIGRIPSSIGHYAVKYAIKNKKKYLIELVACPWDSYWNHSIIGKLIAPLEYLKTKRQVKKSKFVLYVTSNFLQSRYPTEGLSTNCSNVALSDINENILKRRMNRINTTEKSEKIIVGTTAAVNVKYKGQQYVIKALGELKKKGITKYEYQLVGGGDPSYLRKVAEKYDVEDQVKFLGPMQHHRVFEWLDTIDIYVQPSRQEGLPRALIEAMSRGLPAFGARTAGIPELLEREYLFSNNNKNIQQICNILNKYSIDRMKLQAKRNFRESIKYEGRVIETRRKDFLYKFKNS